MLLKAQKQIYKDLTQNRQYHINGLILVFYGAILYHGIAGIAGPSFTGKEKNARLFAYSFLKPFFVFYFEKQVERKKRKKRKKRTCLVLF